ncbi:hypothetical protein A6R73_05930 [Xanthomonas translucens pv. poae]|uniref:NADP-dependent oxidoreductase domain-containing protein n=1 Tax=Xanthomonas graminis pv. poae TaxID=227946 RepID=A0A199NYI4_9XANT|nr:hypothetical protein A6R73_05930 [Xanthomonas translucens pv. poae]
MRRRDSNPGAAAHYRVPGTTNLHRLEENLGAVELQLDASDLARIQEALDAVAIVGDRYSPERQQLVGR